MTTATRRTSFVCGTVILLAACSALQGPTATAVPPKPGAVIATVPIGRGPTLLAIAPDGSVVYASSV